MNQLLSLAQTFVAKHISQSLGAEFVYHDLSHTERVVAIATLLAEHYNITGHELDSLLLACWFHDSGHSPDPNDHEVKGVEFLREFLRGSEYKDFDANLSSSLILATQVNHEPQNLLEEIIKDADLHYLGLEDYFPKSDLLRNEWQVVQGKTMSDAEWYRMNISFFEVHTFYTDFAKSHYGPQKAANLSTIKDRLNNLS